MKSINAFKITTFHCSILLLVCLTLHAFVYAQTNTSNTVTTDEQTIRNLVAQQNEGKNVIQYTDDRIFVSGAYPKPIIGKQRNQENQEAENRIKTERKNYKAKSRIERLQVSQAGDMAYEFGYADLSWDTPKNKHISFESSYLRVWRKIQGEWRVDVLFARPNEPVNTK